LLRQYRRGRIGEADLDQSMAEVEAQAGPLQQEVARVRADLALAQADVPAADEIDGICTLITQGARFVTAEEKRAVLDLLQVRVTMTGYDYTITGIVPQMTVRGTLEVGVLPARGFWPTAASYTYHPRAFVLTGTLARGAA
jgi:uncharacterized small protein (DUF1192 family)